MTVSRRSFLRGLAAAVGGLAVGRGLVKPTRLAAAPVQGPLVVMTPSQPEPLVMTLSVDDSAFQEEYAKLLDMLEQAAAKPLAPTMLTAYVPVTNEYFDDWNMPKDWKPKSRRKTVL